MPLIYKSSTFGSPRFAERSTIKSDVERRTRICIWTGEGEKMQIAALQLKIAAFMATNCACSRKGGCYSPIYSLPSAAIFERNFLIFIDPAIKRNILHQATFALSRLRLALLIGIASCSQAKIMMGIKSPI